MTRKTFFSNQFKSGLYYSYPPKFIGLDLLIDDNLDPHLLEIEQFPALVGSGLNADTKRLKENFKFDLIHLLCAPISPKENEEEDITREEWLELEEKNFQENSFNFERII